MAVRDMIQCCEFYFDCVSVSRPNTHTNTVGQNLMFLHINVLCSLVRSDHGGDRHTTHCCLLYSDMRWQCQGRIHWPSVSEYKIKHCIVWLYVLPLWF